MNAANWQQQQQQMAFQQPMVGGPAGVQGQGYYPMMQPASGGQPGNWAGANPNMAGGYQGEPTLLADVTLMSLFSCPCLVLLTACACTK